MAVSAFDTLVLATHNKGKLKEIVELVAPYGWSVKSASELQLDEPEETGTSFQANAILKARAACDATGLPALADDSGLCVAQLDGAPGIYSARWGGETRDFKIAMAKVKSELKKKEIFLNEEQLSPHEKRAAYFISVLCLSLPNGENLTFEGRVEGALTWPMRGEKGFGYDPIFIPDGHDITFAEMDPEKKNQMSHRTRAFDLFKRDFLEA